MDSQLIQHYLWKKVYLFLITLLCHLYHKSYMHKPIFWLMYFGLTRNVCFPVVGCNTMLQILIRTRLIVLFRLSMSMHLKKTLCSTNFWENNVKIFSCELWNCLFFHLVLTIFALCNLMLFISQMYV